MQTRTSKKQMREAHEMLRTVYGASTNEMVYAAGELDASGKAYVIHNGITTAYKTNTEAFLAACELVFAAEI